MLTHVVAKTLVFDGQGQLLLLRRSANDNHRPGGLDLPGGKVEDGEDVILGGLRELQEEAGLTVGYKDLHWVFADTAANYNTDAKAEVSLVRITLAARVMDPKVTLSHEHDDYSWHTLDEAMELFTGTRYHEVLTYMLKNDIARELWDSRR